MEPPWVRVRPRQGGPGAGPGRTALSRSSTAVSAWVCSPVAGARPMQKPPQAFSDLTVTPSQPTGSPTDPPVNEGREPGGPVPSPAGEVQSTETTVGGGLPGRACRAELPSWASVSPLLPGIRQGLHTQPEEDSVAIRGALPRREGGPSLSSSPHSAPARAFSHNVCLPPLHWTNVLALSHFVVQKTSEAEAACLVRSLDAWAPPGRPGPWPPKIQGSLFRM